jgi:hypothetical protein
MERKTARMDLSNMFLSCYRNQDEEKRKLKEKQKDEGTEEEDELVGSKKSYEKQRSQS